MLFRALCSFVGILYCGATYAAECNYSEQSSFLSRVIAIDSTGGPVYRAAKELPGASDRPSPLELGEKEAVLVFDQGPNSAYTRYILDILDHRCAKAVFFFAGNAAVSNPGNVQEAAHRGHTIAAGPWSTAPNLASLSAEAAQAEIEKGFAAVAKASGGPVAPFFSAPGQNIPPATLDYLKERGISVWPVDIASGDMEAGLTPSKLANRTLERLYQAGKGIIEFHDTRKVTVDALDSILVNMKANGFRLVQILPADNFAPKEEYLANPPKAPGAIAASPTSGAFIEEAKQRVRMSEARQLRRRRLEEAREEAARRERRSAGRQEADRQERRGLARQEAERRGRFEEAGWDAERRERQAEARQEAERRDRQEEVRQAEARREAAERRAQAAYAERFYADRPERRLAHLRREVPERRAQARYSDRPERRRTAQRPE